MFWQKLHRWPRHQGRILKALRAPHAPLRIMLKTRNDPIFLADWHRHHAAIVGAENLIIADNMSNDPQVIALLEELAQYSTVFQFGGFHNDLHRRDRFAALYCVLEDSCDWLILLDTDERLNWVEGYHWIADARLVDRLQALPSGADAMPGLLVQNQPGQQNRFVFPQEAGKLAPVLHWGKPAIASGRSRPDSPPTDSPPTRAQCHNIQFPAHTFAARLAPQLIQLHLCNLVPEQRLRANREKLAARGVCAPDTTYADIARIDVRTETCSVVRRCVLQTRRLLADQPPQSGPALVLNVDGTLSFSTPALRRTFDLVQAEGADRLLAAIAKQP